MIARLNHEFHFCFSRKLVWRGLCFSRSRFQFNRLCNTGFRHTTVTKPVLRSRHFFGRLSLRKSKVPGPTKLGRLRLQAKKGCSGSIHFDHIYRYKLLLSHVILSQLQAFPFLLAKRCSRSRPEKAGSGSRLRPTKKSVPAPPLKWRLCNTVLNCQYSS